MTGTNLIIFHKNCIDGLTSAAIVNYFLGNEVNKQFLPLAYGDGLDLSLLDNDTTLWILDFSFPLELMWDINPCVKKVYWFDHHITQESSLKVFPERLSNFEIISDIKRSGATITWDALFEKGTRPQIVNIAEDRDLWKFKLPFTREYTESMFYDLKDPRDTRWNVLLASDSSVMAGMLEDWRIKGETLLKVKQDRIDRALKSGYYGTIEGCRAYFVNSGVDVSEIGEEIYLSHPDPIIGVIYTYIGVDTVKFSLRSNCIDVQKIAAKFNGGGHEHAAGFVLYSQTPAYRELIKDVPERW